jgi:hypothetical protein
MSRELSAKLAQKMVAYAILKEYVGGCPTQILGPSLVIHIFFYKAGGTQHLVVSFVTVFITVFELKAVKPHLQLML